MRGPILFAASMAAALAVASALRLACLDNRLMHCDEAGQAVKFGLLLERGEYAYDPHEYHGPTLNYLTLPIARLASAQKLTQVTETHLRLLPAIFGIILVGLVWLVRDELGAAAASCAAVLAAVSPAMVFYSRYYIHETLLVCFTFGAIVALWRYVRNERRGREPFCRAGCAGGKDVDKDSRPLFVRIRQTAWLVLLGLGVGLMHATKETCVIPLFCIAVAAAATLPDLRRISGKRLVLSGLLVALVAAGVSALLFSSFLDNPRGVLDSYAAFSHYLRRASGEGSAGSHAYPWYHYFEVLFWWHRGKGPVWTEASIGLLALVGLVAGVLGKGLKPATLPAVRFLGVYTVLMIVVYSAMPYKTPWCALGFLHGLILLAGVGTAVLVRAAPTCPLKAVTVALVAATAGHLSWEAWRASFAACDDPANPYVYAHTTRDVPLLAKRVGQIAAVHPDGHAMYIQLICPDDDYWPLPWYLRGFSRVGPFNQVPQGPPAPLIITQPEMEPALAEHLYEKQPPGRRHLYVPVPPEEEGHDWQLRPHVPLRLYVRLDLWEAYLAD